MPTRDKNGVFTYSNDELKQLQHEARLRYKTRIMKDPDYIPVWLLKIKVLLEHYIEIGDTKNIEIFNKKYKKCLLSWKKWKIEHICKETV